MKIRQVITFILAVVVGAAALPTVTAVSAQVNTETNALSEELASNPDDFIVLQDPLYYYKPDNVFVYFTDSEKSNYISANVAPDYISNTAVNITSTLPYIMFLNGYKLENADVTSLKESGHYVLQVIDDSVVNLKYEFYIAAKATNKEELTLMPEMNFAQVIYKGQDCTPKDSKTLSLEKEGEYTIVYELPKADKEFMLNISVDHTPPALKLEQVKEGSANSAVSLEDYSAQDTIQIFKDDSEISLPYDRTLTDPANYRIILTDNAGNTVEYSFVIKNYFTLSAWMLILCLVGVAAVIAAFVLRTRKGMRVR